MSYPKNAPEQHPTIPKESEKPKQICRSKKKKKRILENKTRRWVSGHCNLFKGHKIHKSPPFLSSVIQAINILLRVNIASTVLMKINEKLSPPVPPQIKREKPMLCSCHQIHDLGRSGTGEFCAPFSSVLPRKNYNYPLTRGNDAMLLNKTKFKGEWLLYHLILHVKNASLLNFCLKKMIF